MRIIKILINVIIFLTFASHAQVNIIYETDMESDIDDAATLGMLHALADNGECNILAVMHNTSDEFGVGVIDAINTWYGRPDIPIGSYKKDDAISRWFGGKMEYAKSIALNPKFHKDKISRKDVPPALDVYKNLLLNSDDKSVTILSVGWTTNLRDLLHDKEGYQLVTQKVKQLVLMGGGWDPPDISNYRPQMNLLGNQVIAAAYESGKYVVENWPTPIVFSGKVGAKVQTGAELVDTPLDNPVREAYRISFAKRGLEIGNSHSSDQTAALYAVRGASDYWEFNTTGTPRIFLKADQWSPDSPGDNRFLRWHTIWDSSVDSEHGYLVFAQEPQAIARVIETLMVQLPKVNFD